MSNRLINSILRNYPHHRDRTVFLSIFAVSFFLRLPFFFRDYVNRDENTFEKSYWCSLTSIRSSMYIRVILFISTRNTHEIL